MPNLRLEAALLRMRQSGQRWSIPQLLKEAGMEENWDNRTEAIKAMMSAAATGKGPPAPPATTTTPAKAEKPSAAAKPKAKAEPKAKAAPKAKAEPKAKAAAKPKVAKVAKAKDEPEEVAAPKGKVARAASAAKVTKTKDEPAPAPARTRARPRLRELVERNPQSAIKAVLRPPTTNGRKRKTPSGKTALVVEAWLKDPSLSPKQLGKLIGVDKRTAEEALLRWTDFSKAVR